MLSCELTLLTFEGLICYGKTAKLLTNKLQGVQ